MIIEKIFKFEAAHKLPEDEIYGACRRLHGHSYKLIIEVEGTINENGWVMNFKDLKNIVNEKIINKFDHSYLNDFFPVATAEIMAQWIYDTLKDDLNIYSVTLYETETSSAKIKR